MRGSGRQAIASAVNFVSYYVFGLPLAIVLALVADMGTFGLWAGLLVGDVLQVRSSQSVSQSVRDGGREGGRDFSSVDITSSK